MKIVECNVCKLMHEIPEEYQGPRTIAFKCQGCGQENISMVKTVNEKK